MNTIELQTYQIRILQILLSNRIRDLDVFMASNDYEGKHNDMADAVRRADQNYRNDLSTVYATLDTANPI